MIDYDILKKFGTTKNRIREVMTAAHNTKDYEIRDRLEQEFQSKVLEGILFNLRNHEVFTSADLAWDGHILNKQIIPLSLYAQGRIDMKQFRKQCNDSGITDDDLKKYCDWDEEKKEFKDMNIAKFVETPVNMVRSYVQRRHAAQASKYLDQFPFLKYETYDRSYEAQLLADITSQRMEIMANDFGYKHQLSQTIRDFLLYPHVVEFAECAWKTEKQYRKNAEGEPEPFIVKEGVPFVAPHPSRVFWDISSPLASINSDTGCDYLGYWELTEYEDIKGNTAFWNREDLDYTGSFSDLYTQYNPYFDIYYPNVMEIPGENEFLTDPAAKNDRENNIGVYNTDEHHNLPMVLTCFFKKLIPKDYGFGDYPYPVWVRFILAGEKTCVYAEVMPDCPAQYYGYNEKDNRLFNISFAHEIMPWQDQISNLMTQLVLSMKQSLLKVLAINIGKMKPEAVQYIRKVMNGDMYAVKPVVLEYDDDKDSAMGVSNKTIELTQANQSQSISDLLRAMIEMNVFAERSLNLSPQEQGQPSPRVTSATEILEIANTINTLYNFISKAIDEGLSAKKRYLYKATVALQEGEIYLSVMGQYPDHVIEKAGFTVEADSLQDGRVKNQRVRGKADRLIYNYVFNSREGSTRTPQVKVAEVLVQLLPQVLQIPGIIEGMGIEKIYELLNAIMRNAGAGIEFKMSALDETRQAEQTVMTEGEQEQAAMDEKTMMAALDQISTLLGQLAGQVQGQEDRIQELQGVADALLGGADRREEGQRFEGGPIEPVPTQGTPASIPQAPREEIATMRPEDPFETEIPLNGQQRANPV
jgi:hypothetical protein